MLSKTSVPSQKSKSNTTFNSKFGDNEICSEPYSEEFVSTSGYDNNDVMANNKFNHLSSQCKEIVNRMAGVKYK